MAISLMRIDTVMMLQDSKFSVPSNVYVMCLLQLFVVEDRYSAVIPAKLDHALLHLWVCQSASQVVVALVRWEHHVLAHPSYEKYQH